MTTHVVRANGLNRIKEHSTLVWNYKRGLFLVPPIPPNAPAIAVVVVGFVVKVEENRWISVNGPYGRPKGHAVIVGHIALGGGVTPIPFHRAPGVLTARADQCKIQDDISVLGQAISTIEATMDW